MKVRLILLIFLLFFFQKSECSENENLPEFSSEESDEDLDELNGGIKKYNYKELDPFENYNKKVFRFNLFLFRNIMLPTIFWIDAWVPKPVTTGYRNFMKNIYEPRNYIVHLLRHDKKKMQQTAKRFFTNTTFGMLGLRDIAGRKYKNYSETTTFDCILRLKNRAGRYMISPITNQYYERAFASNILDWLSNPLIYVNFPLALILYGVDQAILLAPNKKLLYNYRNYSSSGYETVRDIETHNAFDEDFCK